MVRLYNITTEAREEVVFSKVGEIEREENERLTKSRQEPPAKYSITVS